MDLIFNRSKTQTQAKMHIQKGTFINKKKNSNKDYTKKPNPNIQMTHFDKQAQTPKDRTKCSMTNTCKHKYRQKQI